MHEVREMKCLYILSMVNLKDAVNPSIAWLRQIRIFRLIPHIELKKTKFILT